MPKPLNRFSCRKLNEVSIVDEGDNPSAHIVLVKTKDSGDEPGKVAGKSGDQPDKGDIMSKELEDQIAVLTKALADQKAETAALVKAKEDEIAKMKTDAEQAEIAKKAQAEDESFTNFAGEDIKKSAVGPAYSMMKAMNDELVKARVAAETSEFAKRAESEFKHVGAVDNTVALLRMAKRAPEADAKVLTDLMKSYNDMVAAGFKTIGKVKGAVESDDPETKLEAMAKARAKAENITEDEAFVKVLETPEGAELYAAASAQ